MTTPIRLVLVDDHVIVREGLRHVLEESPEFTIVGEGATAAQAIALAGDLKPDVLVLDISMPGGSGLHAVPEISERAPNTRVLMLSVHDDSEYILESVRVGAHGYCRKDSAPEELRRAIKTVFEGNTYFSALVAQRVAQALREGKTAKDVAPTPPPGTEVLSPREREVLRFIAQGRANKEIGVELGISTRTVEAHRQALMKKLDIHTVAGLTRYCLEHGIDVG
ncbi:MAG: response regulator transcription factor [Gemmatimonadaceae bacterium]|nr:response regulator transcription factor [Gemmatimonadaceae bacterium]